MSFPSTGEKKPLFQDQRAILALIEAIDQKVHVSTELTGEESLALVLTSLFRVLGRKPPGDLTKIILEDILPKKKQASSDLADRTKIFCFFVFPLCLTLFFSG